MTNRQADAAIYEIEITLLESEPRIWRRFAVPADITLAKLHRVIQVVMGWTDSHLHQFETVEGVRYEDKDLSLDPDAEAKDERRAKLNDLLSEAGESLLYSYDFGDGWEHSLELVGTGPALAGQTYPVCLAGERACPPEDCGWLTGYYDMLEAIADPRHPEHENMVEWIGGSFDPDALDLLDINVDLAALRPRTRSRRSTTE
jgi:hypothetical protein